MPSKETRWMKRGNCNQIADSHVVMFPDTPVGLEVAKRICADCPEQEACLDFAITHHIDHGVWGGTSQTERKRIRKERRVFTQSA